MLHEGVNYYHVRTRVQVPPFRQGESAHVIGTQDGNGRQLVVCEQSEPQVPAEQMTRCSNVRLRELGP